MTTQIRPSDVILWLRIKSDPTESFTFEWRVLPFRSANTDAQDSASARLFAFSLDQILQDSENQSKFLDDLRDLKSSRDVIVSANVAVYFDSNMALQNFTLPTSFLVAAGPYLSELEISVYSTKKARR